MTGLYLYGVSFWLSQLQSPEKLISISRPRTHIPDLLVKVSKEVVENVAELAQLKLNEDDIQPLIASMSEILDLVEAMQAVDTEGVEPLSNPLDSRQRLRSDEVTETDQREQYQAIAPEAEDGLYLVPRFVE